jgi:hypothetical protein
MASHSDRRAPASRRGGFGSGSSSLLPRDHPPARLGRHPPGTALPPRDTTVPDASPSNPKGTPTSPRARIARVVAPASPGKSGSTGASAEEAGHPLLREPGGTSGRFGLGVLLVALSAATFAVAFRWALAFVLDQVAGTSDIVSAMGRAPLWARLVCPPIGGLLAGVLGLLVLQAPAGQGVGDLMEAVVLGRVHVSMRVTLLKSAASGSRWCSVVP